ncbi:MAG: hypothetical protein MMC33_000891 [Icmadophila ericetorum]|nr:hypothetical protein [Icmadophila ericetorum]
MDFWARLIGGVGTSGAKNNAKVGIPQQRLNAFKRAYNDILQVWHNGVDVSTDSITAEKLRTRLRRLVDLLNDDLRGPTPHLCISFAATSRLLVTVSRIASHFLNDGIIHEALEITTILIDCEDEDFMEDRSFAKSVTALINNIPKSAPLAADIEVENMTVEVLFTIASKIRLKPEILPVWFTPRIHKRIGEEGEGEKISPARGGKEEFPLFFLCLHHIPYEGRTGEFARMGVLYIIEAASRSEDLEHWIVESDMAAMMASGLGAMYSQLSRKLILSYQEDENPTILAFSKSPSALPDAEETTSSTYQAHLATFLSYLVFWQDLFDHCTSQDIKQTLLDHFHYLFLQQLLYPSLMESSDEDGGSAVAVLTYLRHILESIDRSDLVRSILYYLLGIDKKPAEPKPLARPATLARHRKSETLLQTLSMNVDQPSPDLFNLVDLLFINLRGKSQQTITTSLQLCSTLLGKQHLHASSALIRTNYSSVKVEERTIRSHKGHTNTLLCTAWDIDDSAELEKSYERYLQDSSCLIESHPCSKQVLAVPNVSGLLLEERPVLHYVRRQRSLESRTIVLADPLLKCLIALLDKFFLNDIQTNLALTEVIGTLASCGTLRLEGWLVPGADMPESAPIITSLAALGHQVESYKHEIKGFAGHLQELRQLMDAPLSAKVSHTDIEASPRKSEDSKSTSPSRVRASRPMGSISDRLFSVETSSSDSRSGSPRGRQQNVPGAPTIVGRLNHLHLSPARSISSNTSRTYSPSPLRNTLVSATHLEPGGPLNGVSQKFLRKISVTTTSSQEPLEAEPSDTSSLMSDATGLEASASENREVTLGHLLTNVMILQDFLLEIAAIMETRAILFGEVRVTT